MKVCSAVNAIILLGLTFCIRPSTAEAADCPVTIAFSNGILTTRSKAEADLGVLVTLVNERLGDRRVPEDCFIVAHASTFADDNASASENWWAELFDFGESAGLIAARGYRWLWHSLGDKAAQTPLLGTTLQDFFVRAGNLSLSFSFLSNGDLREQVGTYRSILNVPHTKVVIVAHSQGNLYANESFTVLSDGLDGNPPIEEGRIAIVSVATPANFVEGRPPGTHTTLYGDAILKVLGRADANTEVDLTPCSGQPPQSQEPDPNPEQARACHSFVKSYLKGTFSRPRIIDQIVAEIPIRGEALSVPAVDSGWYMRDATNQPGDTPEGANYLAGVIFGPTNEHRNFFVFDLTPISGRLIKTATLRVYNRFFGTDSPAQTETYTLFDVSTLPSVLLSGSGGAAAFVDLGSGTVYGSRVFSDADDNSTVEIHLNAAAVAALNSAEGLFAIGGAVTTLDGHSNEAVFGSSNGQHLRELVLAFEQ